MLGELSHLLNITDIRYGRILRPGKHAVVYAGSLSLKISRSRLFQFISDEKRARVQWLQTQGVAKTGKIGAIYVL
jgi:hypothetical protein